MLFITKKMIEKYSITDIDFMGYSVKRSNASYHHLIVPRRLGGPRNVDNGAILNAQTSHPYLHIVEERDYDIFLRITSEMIDENLRGRIDISNIKRIHDLLSYFEKEHCADFNFYGEPLIRESYVKRLMNGNHNSL